MERRRARFTDFLLPCYNLWKTITLSTKHSLMWPLICPKFFHSVFRHLMWNKAQKSAWKHSLSALCLSQQPEIKGPLCLFSQSFLMVINGNMHNNFSPKVRMRKETSFKDRKRKNVITRMFYLTESSTNIFAIALTLLLVVACSFESLISTIHDLKEIVQFKYQS